MTDPENPQHPALENPEKFQPPKEPTSLEILRRRAAARRRHDPLKTAMNRARRSLLIASCTTGLFAATSLPAALPTTAAGFIAQAKQEAAASHPGSAILAYERAQWIAPNDKTIAAQLSTTRQEAGVVAPVQSPVNRATHAVSFDALAVLGSISLLLFCLLVFGTRLIPTTLRRLSHRAATGLAAVTLLATSAITARWPELNRAVVIGQNSTARIAPADNAAPSSELKPGDTVYAEKTYGKFVHVRASDGRAGWLPGTELERIIPAAS